jgi:hypothetical protein
MVEGLLVVAVALSALSLRRLGVLLRRGGSDEVARLEARLWDHICMAIKESARSARKETATSLMTLGDAVLEQIARNTIVVERQLEVLAKAVIEATSRASGEKLDVVARQAAEDAQRTRAELVEALGSFHRSVTEALREMARLHEEAVRSLRRPVRQALTIREEIRRAHERGGAQAPGEPSGRCEAPGAIWTDDRAEATPTRGTAGEDRSVRRTTERRVASHPPADPDPVTQRQTLDEQMRPKGRAIAAHPRGLAALLSRVYGRSGHISPAPGEAAQRS